MTTRTATDTALSRRIDAELDAYEAELRDLRVRLDAELDAIEAECAAGLAAAVSAGEAARQGDYEAYQMAVAA